MEKRFKFTSRAFIWLNVSKYSLRVQIDFFFRYIEKLFIIYFIHGFSCVIVFPRVFLIFILCWIYFRYTLLRVSSDILHLFIYLRNFDFSIFFHSRKFSFYVFSCNSLFIVIGRCSFFFYYFMGAVHYTTHFKLVFVISIVMTPPQNPPKS